MDIVRFRRAQSVRCFQFASIAAAAVVLFADAPARAQCPGEWILRSPGTAPSARYYGAMAHDSGRGVSVLFGGSTPAGSDETWEWDGQDWTKRNPATSPSARSDHAMAFDSDRGVTVMFGGDDAGGYNGETWEWDGTNWVNKNPATAPSPRHGHAMAYDSARHVTVLFGGFTSVGGDNGETWEWDGTNWTKRTVASAPVAREEHAMAYDSSRGVTVLFGGDAGGDQTWEWDGTSWLRRFPADSPPSRNGFPMVYDSARGASMIFGGLFGVVTAGDTWEWDGTNWKQRTPPVKPIPRYRQASAFDSARGVTVLFGGYDSALTLDNETWEWDGPGPFIIAQPTDQSVSAGQSAMFSVSANGPGPITYQWRRGSADLTDGGSVSGATTDILTIASPGAVDMGEYGCVVSNTCGHVSSQSAELIVQDASCGACGGGMGATMPLAMLGMCRMRRRRVHARR